MYSSFFWNKKKVCCVYAEAAGPVTCLGLGVVPSRKPLRKRLCTFLRYLHLPVPVVRRLLAFSLQLKLRILAAGKPHDEHLLFWMWYELRPQRRHSVCVLLCRLPKLCVPLVIFLLFLNYIRSFDIKSKTKQQVQNVKYYCHQMSTVKLKIGKY